MAQAKVVYLPGVEAKKEEKPKSIKCRRKVEDFNCLGHLLIGTSVGLLVVDQPLAFSLMLFGSLLPDIDHRKSTLGRWNPFARFMKHRGHCHSALGVVLLSLPFVLFNFDAFMWVLTGCTLHLLGDILAGWLPRHRKFNPRLW